MRHERDCQCAVCGAASLEEGFRRFGENLRRNIAEHGRGVIGIFPAEDSADPVNDAFAYTIGNSLRGLPELLLIGMYGERATAILNRVSELVAAKADPFAEGELPLGNASVYLLPVGDGVKDTHTVQASNFLDGRKYRVVQVVLCDQRGRFPWQDGCAEPYSRVKCHRRTDG